MLVLDQGKVVHLETRCNFAVSQKGDFDVLIKRQEIPLFEIYSVIVRMMREGVSLSFDFVSG